MKKVIVGVGVVLRKDNGDFLMLRRKGSHGEGEWAFVGGKVEFGESFEEAGVRELREETGIVERASSVGIISLSNQLAYLAEGVHCVIVGVEVRLTKGAKPEIMESEKCQELGWFNLERLPEMIFEGSRQIIETMRGEGFVVKYLGGINVSKKEG
jgi:8-oxo-dGTP diphosphatase